MTISLLTTVRHAEDDTAERHLAGLLERHEAQGLSLAAAEVRALLGSQPGWWNWPECASYTRISKARGAAGDPETSAGVRRQALDNLHLAFRQQWQVGDVYVDNDVTASGKKRREQFERLLADLSSGRYRLLVVWHPDRLLRITADLVRLSRLCEERRISIVTVKAGQYDLSTATGRMNANILAVISTYELEHSAERLRAKHAQLAREGKPNGGHRWFGYNLDHTICEDEAQLIREAAQAVLGGASLNSIATLWTNLGVPSVTGKTRWGPRTIWQILTRAALSGRREVFTPEDDDPEGKKPMIGRIVAPGNWPAIIDVAESDDLRRLLSDPQRRTRVASGPASKRLLTGLLVCAECGGRLFVKQGDRMTCPWPPKGCGKVTIKVGPLEAQVAEKVLWRIDRGELQAALQEDDHELRQLYEELAATQTQQATLATLWAEKKLTDAAWEAARGTLNHKEQGLRKRLQAAQEAKGIAAIPDALSQVWPELPTHKQRAIIALLVDKIVVSGTISAPGAEPQVVWKR